MYSNLTVCRLKFLKKILKHFNYTFLCLTLIPSWGPSIGPGVVVLTIQNLHFLHWLHRNLTICSLVHIVLEKKIVTPFTYILEPILEHQSWSGLRFYQFRNVTLNKSFSVNIGIFGEVVFHKKIVIDKYLILTVSFRNYIRFLESPFYKDVLS